MKTSIATVSISGDLREKLAAIAAAGFDGVEIFENDFLAFDGTPAEVGRMVRDHGLEITLFQPFRDFEGLPEPQRARAFDRAERKFDLMHELGTDLMLICSNVSPLSLGGVDRAAADFHELGNRAGKRGLRVGYEALAWGRHVNDHRDAWEIVRRADHPAVGIILDSFHTLARGIDPQSIRSIPGDRIFIVQLADAPRLEMDLLSWSRHYRNMPGQGDLPVTDFMVAVSATGYRGVISLEVFNDQFRGGSPKTIAIDGRRSLTNLMDRVRRAAPELAVVAPELPERVGVLGVEFVEFAADEHEAEELGGLLATMGFTARARHRTKDVVLWRQADGGRGINIVVNTEQEGFAHTSYVVHGTNAYALGLRVENAPATVARARALGAEPFEQKRGPQDLAIPAIRGVGGGVVYFIDDALSDVWDVEFEKLQVGAGSSAGLTSMDHVAQTMNYEEMLTWILFYTSIFDTQKKTAVDVVDPGGLVRSQVIESPGGRLRLTLNGAESHKTLAGHFIAESSGSSIQHLAFATDDMLATAARLRQLGFAALDISTNYFDDLEARFDIPADLAAALREYRILYDRDEHGEYLQMYSRTYGEGFFFEIVERRGGYKGYGAPNAPFRIAAQKRSLRPKGMLRL